MVVAVIGIPDAGVILSTSGGMEVEFPSSKVDDDGTLGGVVVAVIGKLDAGVILSTSGRMEQGCSKIYFIKKHINIYLLFLKLVNTI